MRLFVAMDVPEAVREALGKLRARFEEICRDARWTRLEGAHGTLKFIGEVSGPCVDEVGAALGAIAPRPPIEVRFAGLGFFPNERRPRVFWAGIEGGEGLRKLAIEIETRLEPLGIARENREFRPHLTLARFDSPKPGSIDRLLDAAAEFTATEFGRTSVDEFHLYQSMLKRTGAEYTRLATYCLAPEPGS